MSKHNNRKHTSGLSEITGLPFDVIGPVPIFQLYSDRELIIEGAKNLEYYDESCAKIMTEKLYITIIGESLIIKCLANKNLSVCGEIRCLQLEHKNRSGK